jgi:hypothetical protein
MFELLALNATCLKAIQYLATTNWILDPNHETAEICCFFAFSTHPIHHGALQDPDSTSKVFCNGATNSAQGVQHNPKKILESLGPSGWINRQTANSCYSPIDYQNLCDVPSLDGNGQIDHVDDYVPYMTCAIASAVAVDGANKCP